MKINLIALLTAFLGALIAVRTSAQTLTPLFFPNNADGYEYSAGFTLSGSTLYATAASGGADNHGGVFSFPVGGSAPTLLGSFNGANGDGPTGDLTLVGSMLYGTTDFGGASDDGTIFSVPTSGGTPTLLGAFNGANGANPNGSLTLVGSTLYGMAPNGGANGDGAIVSIPLTGGPIAVVASFDGANGAEGRGSLTLSGSTFYGMTQLGGANNLGTVFSIPVSGGTPTTLLSFNASTGDNPHGSLTLNGSTLYGMTTNGGANGDGTVFSIPTSGGNPTILGSFNGADGAHPQGGNLTLIGSYLYGITWEGGAKGMGTIFSIPLTGGTPTALASFDGSNGAFSTGSLTLAGSTLYGMAIGGSGGIGQGTIFSLTVDELNNGSAVADHNNNANQFGPPLISIVGQGASYSTLGSTVASTTGAGGGPMLGSTATILAGTNSGTFTGGATTVSMAWRTRVLTETSHGAGGKPASPPLPGSQSPLISDVLQLTGLSNGSVDPSQADPFALQMTYNAALLSNETVQAAGGAIYLAWLNPNGAGNGVPLWQNAILGNIGNNATFAEMNFQGSFAAFQTAVHDTNIADYVGAWGVDPANHDVWAVVNHDSQFAVVPEPSSMILLAIGTLGLALAGALRWRR